MQGIDLTPDAINLSFEDVYIETEDRIKINGWFILFDNAKYTVLFLHGNAGNISHRLEKIQIFHDLGLNLFIIDYRGYGRSQGRPSENGIYLDAKAAYDYLLNQRKIKPEQIILYGESLGTACAINLASQVKIGGLITEGAFSKAKDMARHIFPLLPSFLFANKFDNLTKIKKVKAAKLFLHSRNDEIVPFKFSEKLYDAAAEPKFLREIRGGHNTAFLDSAPLYSSLIAEFIKILK